MGRKRKGNLKECKRKSNEENNNTRKNKYEKKDGKHMKIQSKRGK